MLIAGSWFSCVRTGKGRNVWKVDDDGISDCDFDASVLRNVFLAMSETFEVHSQHDRMGRGCTFKKNVAAGSIVGVLSGTWKNSKSSHSSKTADFDVEASHDRMTRFLDCTPAPDLSPNPCALINHHCRSSNLQFERRIVESHLFIVAVATKNCSAGEWALINYGKKFFSRGECHCCS